MALKERYPKGYRLSEYNELESVLKKYAIRFEEPMAFYRALFPEGSFGSDLNSGIKGESYGIFGLYPDIEIYKRMKSWIDRKNNLILSDADMYHADKYVLNEREQECMMRYYITKNYCDLLLEERKSFINYDKLRTLTDEEFFKELSDEEQIEGWSEFVAEAPNINYPIKEKLSPDASRSEKMKAKIRYDFKCALAEYDYDIRYAKLDAQFSARAFSIRKQIDENEYYAKAVQSEYYYPQRIDDSLRQLRLGLGQQSCNIAPADYYGKKHSSETIGRLYAIAIDIDDMFPASLEYAIQNDFYGFRPTYIVQSGTGMHFFYFLDEPLKVLYSYRKKIEKLKKGLALFFMGPGLSKKIKPDNQSWAEQFRMVGSKSKVYGKLVNAYKFGDVWSIENLVHLVNTTRKYLKLGEFSEWKYRQTNVSKSELVYRPTDVSKSELKKNKKQTKKINYVFKINGRGYYDSWKDRIMDADALGTRYHRTCILFTDAAFCHIPYEEVYQFATTELYEYFNLPYISQGNRFLLSDIKAAAKCYKIEGKKQYSLEKIRELTNIELPRAKRNERSRKEHIEYLKYRRDKGEIPDTRFDSDTGREAGLNGTKEQIIREYLRGHPEAKKCEVIRATGLSNNTVYKWYRIIKGEESIDNKEQIIREYLQEHPEAKKCEVIRATGFARNTVYKWYKIIKDEGSKENEEC